MLQPEQIIAYISALGIAAAIPGPGITALVARSVSGGAATGFMMLAGLIMGDLIYLTLAVFGLAVVAQHFHFLLMVISLGSSLYLAWLAWQFLRYQPDVMNIDQKATKRDLSSALLSGFTITLGNPKTIAFYMAILPLVISLDSVSITIWWSVLIPLTITVLLVVGSTFILSAVKVRRFLASKNAQVILFRGAGMVMLTTAAVMMSKII